MNATEKRTGQAVELARYVTDLREERILIGRRIDGIVRVFDAPLRGSGRTYRVESGFETKAELAMLRRDYLEQAERLGDCPGRLSYEPTSPAACRRDAASGGGGLVTGWVWFVSGRMGKAAYSGPGLDISTITFSTSDSITSTDPQAVRTIALGPTMRARVPRTVSPDSSTRSSCSVTQV